MTSCCERLKGDSCLRTASWQVLGSSGKDRKWRRLVSLSSSLLPSKQRTCYDASVTWSTRWFFLWASAVLTWLATAPWRQVAFPQKLIILQPFTAGSRIVYGTLCYPLGRNLNVLPPIQMNGWTGFFPPAMPDWVWMQPEGLERTTIFEIGPLLSEERCRRTPTTTLCSVFLWGNNDPSMSVR